MITTKELCKWHEIVLKTKERAKNHFDEYKDNIAGGNMAGYYEYLEHISSAQLAIIERLIEQSRANEKEQICQK